MYFLVKAQKYFEKVKKMDLNEEMKKQINDKKIKGVINEIHEKLKVLTLFQAMIVIIYFMKRLIDAQETQKEKETIKKLVSEM